jgi:hypothetical protein
VTPTIQAPDSATATRGTNERFVELVCADEDLLRAEFDAIIAARWPSPPPAEPDHRSDTRPHPRRARHRRDANAALRPIRPRHHDISALTRQRSPRPQLPTPTTGRQVIAPREPIPTR